MKDHTNAGVAYSLAFFLAAVCFLLLYRASVADNYRDVVWNCVFDQAQQAGFKGGAQDKWATFSPLCFKP